jgi:A/G-specific adenine glycosylase
MPVAALLGWFDANARDLPWRRTSDPYAIWVSEIMLQQTQVRTVIPYWERWMKSLPDVARLARADDDRVLKLWEGLGYYSRARNLQRAAREIMGRFGGAVPAGRDALLGLPGIGPYTAGAIASIAFDRPEPILDGNVMRVLTRLLALRGDPKAGPLNRRLWKEARALVQTAAALGNAGERRCSRLNQALMELGATVCTPAAPDCARCPWAGGCRARRSGRAEDFPRSPGRPAAVARLVSTALILRSGRWLVRRRSGNDVNAGLWEFPNFPVPDGEAPLALLSRTFGIAPGDWRPRGEIRHSVTRHRITQKIFGTTTSPSPDTIPGDGRWATAARLGRLAMTGPHRKLALALVAAGRTAAGNFRYPPGSGA